MSRGRGRRGAPTAVAAAVPRPRAGRRRRVSGRGGLPRTPRDLAGFAVEQVPSTWAGQQRRGAGRWCANGADFEVVTLPNYSRRQGRHPVQETVSATPDAYARPGRSSPRVQVAGAARRCQASRTADACAASAILGAEVDQAALRLRAAVAKKPAAQGTCPQARRYPCTPAAEPGRLADGPQARQHVAVGTQDAALGVGVQPAGVLRVSTDRRTAGSGPCAGSSSRCGLATRMRYRRRTGGPCAVAVVHGGLRRAGLDLPVALDDRALEPPASWSRCP